MGHLKIHFLKEKLEGLSLSEDSSLGNTVLNMAHQSLQCLEELSIRKGDVK